MHSCNLMPGILEYLKWLSYSLCMVPKSDCYQWLHSLDSASYDLFGRCSSHELTARSNTSIPAFSQSHHAQQSTIISPIHELRPTIHDNHGSFHSTNPLPNQRFPSILPWQLLRCLFPSGIHYDSYIPRTIQWPQDIVSNTLCTANI